MDLDLSLGLSLSGRRRQRSLQLGFDLALASPAPLPPSTASASSSSSSSSGDEPLPTIPQPASMADPPPFPLPPRFPPSCAFFPDPAARDRPREYSPYSPSYPPLAPAYAPMAPPPPPLSRAPGAFYTPSFVRVFPADHVSDHGFPPHRQYDPRAPAGAEEEEAPPVRSNGAAVPVPHDPYSPPPFEPLSVIPEDRQEAAYAQRPLFSGPPGALVREDDGAPTRPRFFGGGIRLRRLLALRRSQWDGGPFRTPSPEVDERPSSAPPMGSGDSEASTEISGKNKAGNEGVTNEALEEDEEEGGRNAVNFECNICLELAKEPVVTPCGHLFCWPCLFQWLHLHCNYNECPVCKGEVVESEITPIYGRGSSQSRVEEVDGVSGLKIPPRPRGRRSDSWRQRVQRPMLRRYGREVADSWRRLFGEEVHFGNMIDDPGLQQMIGVGSTSMGHGTARVGDDMEGGYVSIGHPLPWRSVSPFPQNGGNTNPIFRGSLNELWAQVSSNGLDVGGSLGAAAVGPSSALSRTDSTSALLLNTRNLGGAVRRAPVMLSRAVGQASASSTMAVIQGDVGIADGVAEPNRAGSSRNSRIRGRSSGSSYADGSSMHACKGRRLN